MTTMTSLPDDHPAKVAWEKYKLTEDYANSFEWAEDVQHRGGSMWTAFLEGWNAAHSVDAAVHNVDAAVFDVLQECKRQDKKWGEQNHDPFAYLTVLVEEVGEFAQAALHKKFGGRAASGLRTEAVHVAAVALAIIRCLDRGKWFWGR